MSKKKYRDMNGFLHLEETPISRVQVAPYLGKQIDSKGKMPIDPKLKREALYPVLRSAEELFDPETMESFNGMPFRVGHQMLGKTDMGANRTLKSVDSEPVDGCIFNVRRSKTDPDYLVADIVIYTEKALKAIANGTKELSLGYRCVYVPVDSYPEPKYYKGEPYLFTQQGIAANHLALVPRGRAGSTVCVQDEAVVTADGLVITCDSLPEEIQLMEKNEKTAKEKLTALLMGSEEDIQDCLDYCDFTKEQKAKIKEFKAGKAEEVPAQDAKCECKTTDCGDAKPPTPPPAKDAKPVEVVNPAKADEEKKPEEAAPAPAEEKPAEPAPAPAPEAKPAETPAPTKEEPAPAPAPAEEKPAEEPAKDCKPKKAVVEDKACCDDPKDENPKDGKCDNCGKPVAEDCGDKGKKVFTQDEFDEACRKAEAKGRKDGFRAKLLADAVGEDADGKSEGDVARAACKKIKGLEFAADASDDVALAAIRAHLATQRKAAKPAPAEVEEEEEEEVEVKKPAAPKKKTLLSVTTQDEAFAKTHGSFNAGDLKQFLATH